MAQPNLVSINIPEADLAEIKAGINVLVTKLLPHLKTLLPEERQELPKMGNKTVSFVQKTLEYCRQNPDLVPQFLDVDDLETDVKAVELLRSLYQPLLQLTESISDTMTLSGSEAYTSSLMFYNSIKNAMKSKIQKAETISTTSRPGFPKGKERILK